mgnify:FL=1
MKEQELINAAKKAMEKSYAPYSHFNVGAALYCGDGKVYLGANIENSSFSLCCCAERNAVFRAVNDGERNFKAIAVVGGKNHKIEKYCPPCGACRQVLTEFCKEDFEIILTDGQKIKTFKLKDIMPLGFSL